MELNLHFLLAVLGMAFVPATAALLAMSFSARARALRAEQIVRDLTVVLAARGQTNTRNAPLDMRDTIEALAVEVERIAEGQRFTTRLLSEARIDRGMIASDNSHGRSITPH